MSTSTTDESGTGGNPPVPGVPPSGNMGPNDFERPAIARWQINALGIMLILIALFVGFLMYGLWPTSDSQEKWATRSHLICCKDEATKACGWHADLAPEQRIIILVLLAGALGSFVHAATSFSNYVGMGRIEKSWIWWYVLRLFIGMSLALIFYLVFRGGLLTDTRIEDMNIYGVLTVSALAGLFTDRAALKLSEIFETLFKPQDKRKDKLDENKNELASSGGNG